jgi:heme exporter protein A
MITALSAEALALDRGGRRLFHGLSFELSAGEALALTGPNGAGKTSLLRAVAGLLRPAEGAVRFKGPAGDLDPQDARAGLHWLGAQDGLKSARTADRELRFWSQWSPAPPEGPSPPEVASALDQLGLLTHARTAVRRLSTGQRRRLALARLLARPRPLWLLDEPLAPLDAGWRVRVGELMRAHLDGGGLLLAAVHDPLPVPARELALDLAA